MEKGWGRGNSRTPCKIRCKMPRGVLTLWWEKKMEARLLKRVKDMFMDLSHTSALFVYTGYIPDTAYYRKEEATFITKNIMELKLFCCSLVD